MSSASPLPSLSEGPLGVFGGTFDPVHLGHLRLAEEAAETLGLDRVLWLPAGQPPHREGPRVAAADRLAMVRLATAGNPRFAVDPAEVEAAQPSYTVLTLQRLRQSLGPARPLVLLLGTDAFSALPTWHRWSDLLHLAHIGVAHRAGAPPHPEELPAELVREFIQRHSDDPAVLRQHPAGRVVVFAMTPLDISATRIRALLAARRSPRYLVPSAVLDYIEQNGLYR
jgi:nicotinate-nucleotide adenylyltransferase